MNMSIENIPVCNVQEGNMRFLIKAVNNILEKYKNMQVVDIYKSSNTSYIDLKDGSFKVVIAYNNFIQTLRVEIKNAKNFEFEEDLRKELEEVLKLD